MPTKSYIPIPKSAEKPWATTVIRMIISVVRWGAHVWQMRRQRKALAALDSRLLRDVGLTHDDVRRELKKSFWQ